VTRDALLRLRAHLAAAIADVDAALAALPADPAREPADLLTTSEAAQRFNVPPDTVRDWIESGVIGTWPDGARHRVSAKEVQRRARRRK
jgi:excisionase family DNA binding protein